MAIAPSRANFVSPSSQKSTSSCSASRISFQCGRSILDCVHNSEPGTIVGASTSGSVKYVGTVLPLCPLVPAQGDPTAPVPARRRRSRNCHLSSVSQSSVTLDHCWQWRPQCIFQLLEVKLPPCHVGHEGRLHFDVPLCLVKGLFDLRRLVLVLSDLPTSIQFFHDQINAVILHQRVVLDDPCCSPTLAFELSQKPSTLPVLFCNDEVACQSRRSRFHCRYVYASVGAEKLGGGSCPNRGPTAVSSSTLSHCLAMVSSHAELRYQLWIFRLRILHKIDSIVIL